jgi:uncharacterized RDD family membrane protein YckC
MKCPRCNFVVANSKDACPRCNQDLSPLKKELGLVAPKNIKLETSKAPFAKTPNLGAESSGKDLTPNFSPTTSNQLTTNKTTKSPVVANAKVTSLSQDTLPTITPDGIQPIDDLLFDTPEQINSKNLVTKSSNSLDSISFEDEIDEPLFSLEKIEPLPLPEDIKEILAPTAKDSSNAPTPTSPLPVPHKEDLPLTLQFEDDALQNFESQSSKPDMESSLASFSLSFETAVESSIKDSTPALDNSQVFKAAEPEEIALSESTPKNEVAKLEPKPGLLKEQTIKELDALFKLSLSLQQQLSDTISATKKIAEKNFEIPEQAKHLIAFDYSNIEKELEVLLEQEQEEEDTLSDFDTNPVDTVFTLEAEDTQSKIQANALAKVIKGLNHDLSYELNLLQSYEKQLSTVATTIAPPPKNEDVIYEIEVIIPEQSKLAPSPEKKTTPTISGNDYRNREYNIDNSDLLKAFSDIEVEIQNDSANDKSESTELESEEVKPQVCAVWKRFIASSIDTLFILGIGTLFSLAVFLPELRSQLLGLEIPSQAELIKNSFIILSCCFFTWMISMAVLNSEGLQTVGGKYLGIITVDENYQVLTLKEAILRALSLNATLLTFGLGNLLSLGKNHQALHDKIAKTLVIREIKLTLSEQIPAFVNRIHQIEDQIEQKHP